MIEERDYLQGLLIESGIKAPIHMSLKKLKASDAIRIGGILTIKDTLKKSGNKRIYTDADGNKKRRIKVFDRTTSFRVVIGEADTERCESIFLQFLDMIAPGLDVDGNWENILVREADWVEDGDSILKAKSAVQIDITFEGGVYKDRNLVTAKIDGLEARKDEE